MCLTFRDEEMWHACIFYNTKRPHRTLNYKCPDEVEKISAVQAVRKK